MWPFYFPIIYLCFIYVIYLYIYIASCHIFSTNHKAGKFHKKLIVKKKLFSMSRPVAGIPTVPNFRPFCSNWNGFRDSASEFDIGNVKNRKSPKRRPSWICHISKKQLSSANYIFEPITFVGIRIAVAVRPETRYSWAIFDLFILTLFLTWRSKVNIWPLNKIPRGNYIGRWKLRFKIFVSLRVIPNTKCDGGGGGGGGARLILKTIIAASFGASYNNITGLWINYMTLSWQNITLWRFSLVLNRIN